MQSLEQQREPVRVGAQQLDGAAAVPVLEREVLVLGLLVRPADLEHCGPAGRGAHRYDERDVAVGGLSVDGRAPTPPAGRERARAAGPGTSPTPDRGRRTPGRSQGPTSRGADPVVRRYVGLAGHRFLGLGPAVGERLGEDRAPEVPGCRVVVLEGHAPRPRVAGEHVGGESTSRTTSARGRDDEELRQRLRRRTDPGDQREADRCRLPGVRVQRPGQPALTRPDRGTPRAGRGGSGRRRTGSPLTTGARSLRKACHSQATISHWSSLDPLEPHHYFLVFSVGCVVESAAMKASWRDLDAADHLHPLLALPSASPAACACG